MGERCVVLLMNDALKSDCQSFFRSLRRDGNQTRAPFALGMMDEWFRYFVTLPKNPI